MYILLSAYKFFVVLIELPKKHYVCVLRQAGHLIQCAHMGPCMQVRWGNVPFLK